MKKNVKLGALGVCMLTAGFVVNSAPAASAKQVDPHDMRFVNVIKVTANAWFQNMEHGVKAFAKDTGVKATQTGPAQATSEGQVSIIQNLIPQKPTAIGVDPNSQQALEGVLGKAQKAGIFVFSQEAPQLKHTNLDLEAFSNAEYGRQMMDALASCMGGKGEYVTFVGHLTAASHMAWAQAELNEAKAKFPGIKRVTGPVVANENSEVAYQKTKELLAKYPHIKGFLGSASTDIPGIARAVTEVKAGTIQDVFLWDSALTAHAVMNGALMMLQGKKVGVGTDLGVPGYTNLKKCEGSDVSAHCFQGNAILKLTKANIGKYNF
jgi:simple sugar transport system substrate-binding protein